MKKKPNIGDLTKLRRRPFLTPDIKERLKNRLAIYENKIRIVKELLNKPTKLA